MGASSINRGRQLIDLLAGSVVVCDGATGTFLYDRGVPLLSCYDELNLTRPHLVKSVHEAYLDAGAELIETNTFGANRTKLRDFGLEEKAAEINEAGARLARLAAGGAAFVAGSVGPLAESREEGDQLSSGDKKEVFREQIVGLASGGVDLIMLETFSILDDLLLALEACREATDLPVAALMAFLEKGGTAGGVTPQRFAEALDAAGADVIGVNCGSGPLRVKEFLEAIAPLTSRPLAGFPNAGFPEYVDGRYMYLSSPDYAAEVAVKMASGGVSLVGGCCGTTPDYVRAIRAAVAGIRPGTRPARPEVQPRPGRPRERPPAAARVAEPPESLVERVRRQPIVVVELDPPTGLLYEKVLEGSQVLKEAGAHAITVGDNPLAVTRMSNLAMASMIEREVGLPAIIHISCRDRNLIGTQSILLGCAALGIRYVLAITGDPARVGPQPGATSVYDLNSFKLIELMANLNKGINAIGKSIGAGAGFLIGAALNPNGRNPDGQLKRLGKKVELGAHYCLTQPVYDAARIREVWTKGKDLGIPIFLGILPLVSERNAEFLHNEVPGIDVPLAVRRRMKGLSDEAGRRMGIEISKEIIDEVKDVVSGYYLIPPFGRYHLAEELTRYVLETVIVEG